jgi:twinkle protein
MRNGKPDHGYFPRPCEVTVWTGVTSHGKSTFLRFFIMSAVCSGINVFIANLEEKAETSLRKMMASFFSRPPTEADIDTFMDNAGFALVFSDTVGFITQDELIEQMMFAARRYGCTHFIVDSLMRVDGLEEDYPGQGQFMNRLQVFAKETSSHVHLVAHPRKMGEDGKPAKMDVKGSSVIPNNADSIVAVCRNFQKDQLRKDGKLTDLQKVTMYDTEIRVEKQRETGWEGRFLLRFDPITFSYSPFIEVTTEPPPERRLRD